MKEHHPINNLKDLQVKYPITPIDKATKYVAFISQRFYAHVLVKDLGQQNSNACNTYCRVLGSNTGAIKSNKAMLQKKIDLNLSSEDKKLPHTYYLPKLHKYPTGSRFIIAALKYSVKPLRP